MNSSDYAYSVARIRYRELSLFTSQELEQLIGADSVKTVLRLLADKGWNVPEDGTDCSAMLEEEADDAWKLLVEAAPDIRVFDALIIANDFHNLKASIKCLVTDSSPSELFIAPSVSEPAETDAAIREKRFDDLPVYLRKAAQKSYEAAVTNENGWLSDIIIDKYCMQEKIKTAEHSKVTLLIETARLSCAAADIKIALRSAATGKDADFMKRAMADSGIIDSERLIEAALKGRADIIEYLSATKLDSAARAISDGNAVFEKWCDDIQLEKLEGARSSAFGAEPLAAYYMSKDTDVRNVRIIISAKQNGLSDEEIRKRVRRAYA